VAVFFITPVCAIQHTRKKKISTAEGHSKCFELIIIAYIYVCSDNFVGTFEYLHKAPISCPTVCPSVCVYQRSSHWMHLCEIWYWGHWWKSVEKNQNL